MEKRPLNGCKGDENLDDGVSETVLGGHVADAGRRALLEGEVEQGDVDGLTRLDLDLPRALGRATAGAGLCLGGDDRRDVAGRASDVRRAHAAARAARQRLHCSTQPTPLTTCNRRLKQKLN